MTSSAYYASEIRGKTFDVRDAGAYVDDSHDDTVAVQDTINACVEAGGGDVVIPDTRKSCIIDGALQRDIGGIDYKSQLYVPYAAYNDTERVHIRIRGEYPPSFVQSGPLVSYKAPTTGSRLRSTLVSDVSDSYLIASRQSGGTTWQYYNYNDLSIENLSLLVAVNGSSQVTLGGVDVRETSDSFIKNVTIFPFNIAMQDTAAPINNCIGLAMGKRDCYNAQLADNVAIGGFDSGIYTGDHTSLRDVQIICCKYGYKIGANYQAMFAMRIGAYWCINDFYFTGAANVKVSEFQSEWRQVGKWYDSGYTILDTSNYGHGEINYSMTEAGVGFNNAKFTKSGGANLQCIPIAFSAASAFTITGARDDGTALADLLSKLAAKGIIIDNTTES